MTSKLIPVGCIPMLADAVGDTMVDRRELIRRLRESKEFRHAFMCDTVRRSIATQVRQLRESRGWSQAELAAKLGTGQANVSAMESPNRKGFISIKTLLKIASIFDVALIIKFVSYSRFLEEMVFITPEGVIYYIPSIDKDLRKLEGG